MRIQRKIEMFPSYSASNIKIDGSIEIATMSKALKSLSNGIIIEDNSDTLIINSAVDNVVTTFKKKTNEDDDTKKAKTILIENFIGLSANILQMNKEWKQLESADQEKKNELRQKDRELDAWLAESKKMDAAILKLKKKVMKKNNKKM